MKHHGLIFDSESINGFLRGDKTRTSRVLSPHVLRLWKGAGVDIVIPQWKELFDIAMRGASDFCTRPDGVLSWTSAVQANSSERANWVGKLRYAVGDLVYAKEALIIEDKGVNICYATTPEVIARRQDWPWESPTLSPMFMPKCFARFWFEIVGIDVQRVQDISEEDAKAEGVRNCEDDKYAGACRHCEGYGYYSRRGKDVDCHFCDTYAKRFSFRWDSINAARGHGWDKNPPVVALKLKRVDPPANSI